MSTAAAAWLRAQLRRLNKQWVAVIGVGLMVASDYKFRVRPVDESLGGRPDLAVLVELAIYGAAGAYLLFVRGRPPRDRRPPLLLFLAWGWAITMAASALWAPYPQLAMVRGSQLLLACAFAHTVTRQASRDQLRVLATVFVGLVTVSVLIGLAHPFPRPPIRADRFQWIHMHPVHAGTYLGIAVVLLAGVAMRTWMRRDRPMIRVVIAGLLVLNTAALVATKTRGALAGVVVALLVLVIAAAGQRRRDLLVVAGAGGMAMLLLFASNIANFLERGDSPEALATLNSRTVLWGQALDAVAEKPLLGWGLTSTRGLFFDETGLGGAHNAAINVLTDGGLIGAAWWIALLAALALLLHRANRGDTGPPVGDAAVLLAVLAFLVVDGLTTEGLGAAANSASMWLFILVGWAGVLLRRPVTRRRDAGRVVVRTPASRLPDIRLPQRV